MTYNKMPQKAPEGWGFVPHNSVVDIQNKKPTINFNLFFVCKF